jgi:hypothetical protein
MSFSNFLVEKCHMSRATHVTWVLSKVTAKINGWNFLLIFETLGGGGGLMSLFKRWGLNYKYMDTSRGKVYLTLMFDTFKCNLRVKLLIGLQDKFL